MKYREDEQLIRLVQKGDVDAFEELVVRYQQRLFFFVRRIVGDPRDAEEVVTDAFFQLYRTITRVDTSRRFSTYLFSIAKNTALSLLRRRKDARPLDFAADVEADEVIYSRLVNDTQRREILEALTQLTDAQRMAIMYYYFDELSYEEVSDKMGIPLNTVRTHLRRAKEALRGFLHES